MADIIIIAHDEFDGLPDLDGDTAPQEERLVLDDNFDPLLLDRLRLGSRISRTRSHSGQQQCDHAHMNTASAQIARHVAPRSCRKVQNHFFVNRRKDTRISY